ncbi:MAG TPA: ATP-binding protein [Candidatus Acidoferrales bacterium]|nr:ATP-binding protein [Candidatus Acidoferrales bacterium]
MAPLKPVPLEALYTRCDSSKFSFRNTSELEELTELIGQERAAQAIEFGVGIQQRGFNLFLLGPGGTGKYTAARSLLERKAIMEPQPDDWCYVNNFEDPENPHALRLPPGRGAKLRDDLSRLLDDLRSAIPSAFESENYEARKHVIEHDVKERQEKDLDEVQKEADAKDIALLRTPSGLVLAPTRKGEVVPPEEFGKLAEAEHQRIQTAMSELQEKLHAVLHHLPRLEQEGREQIRALNEEVATFAVGHLIGTLREKYADLPQVEKFLEAVEADIIDNVDEFIPHPESPLAAIMGGSLPFAARGSAFLRRYQVNVLVDHSADRGAPVVYEDHPTYQNLVGQVEYMSHLGALSTDFNLIRAGALHRANGGYLILDAHKLLMQPYAWDALKRSLESSQIRIESLGQALGLMSTVSLEPQPIPLDVKVVLAGERLLYYLLSSLDTDFNELFKVAADFEDRMERSPESELLYARMVGTVARSRGLLPLDRDAVGRVIEQNSRIAGDSGKVLIHRRTLADLLQEADYCARQAKRPEITAADVQRAIDAQIHRADRVRQQLLEETVRGTILIDTEGERVGQVNGLSVVELGQFAFGHPSRITARVRLGKGEVIDIEREVELSGPIHSKGVLILSAFLGARYASGHPLSLSASLVFEQSYGGVEGDSASSAELYALLSALSGLPIKQSLAVTGSVNQHGEVQAIGGVNEKIEGFFDLCKARGDLGGQGVIIPSSNVRHLMLRRDVVDAVRAGQFQVFAVETIDQGIEILTGKTAGERDGSGNFPDGSVNQRVEARLIELAAKRFAAEQKAKLESRE